MSRLAAPLSLKRTAQPLLTSRTLRTSFRLSSTSTSASPASKSEAKPDNESAIEAKAQESAAKHTSTHKTQAQLDEELMQKMAGISGDGGDFGVEYEDGKPTSMKKSVKNNMFRYI